MTEFALWRCPRCRHETHAAAEVTGVQHTCAMSDGDLVKLEPAGDSYLLYCGNCRDLCLVAAIDLADGELWLCPTCRKAAA